MEGQRGVRVETVPSRTYYLTWFNCGRKPITDPSRCISPRQTLLPAELVVRASSAAPGRGGGD